MSPTPTKFSNKIKGNKGQRRKGMNKDKNENGNDKTNI